MVAHLLVVGLLGTTAPALAGPSMSGPAGDGGVAPALPLVPSTELLRAGRSLARGEYLEAQTLVGAMRPANALETEEAKLISGVAARGREDFSAAAAALSTPSPHLGPLEAYRLAYFGDALFYSGDYAGAAKAFAEARAGGIVDAFNRRMSGRLADALLADGRGCDAAKVIREAKRMESSPERLDTFVRAESHCSEGADVQQASRRLWLDFPDHPAAVELDAAQRTSATAADRIHRASRLLLRAEAALALDETALGLELHPTSGERAHLELLKAKALLELGQRPLALTVLAAAAKHAPKSDAGREAQTDLARAAWRDGRITDAEAAFQRIAADKGDHVGEEAAFLYAYLAFDRADGQSAAFDTASARFLAFREAHPHSRKGDEATWFAAYSAYRAGKPDDARQLFAELVENYASSPLAQQGLYWEAKTSVGAEAQRLYREVIQGAPLTYYAAMARQRLAEVGAPAEPLTLRAELPNVAPPTTDPLLALAMSLDAVGLDHERGEALDAAAHGTSGEANVFALAMAAARLGEWGRAYGLANGRLWHRAFEERDPGALALLFPRAYRSEVEAAGASYGFDPAFVWAIMRRESAFDPAVESAARAIGLMQMLLPTAQKISRILDEAPPDVDQLHQPEREIPIAVWYLAELDGRFGLAGLAAAAYNAGPAAVSKWVAKNGALPFDEFVEAIPFRETRLYVKNVLGDYLAYRALYPTAGPALPVATVVPPANPGANF